MASISVSDVSLDYTVRSSKRLLHGFRDKSLKSRIGGNFIGTRSVRALDSIDLKVSAGDRLAVVGSNGSGKTSLLMVLSGIYEPTSGEVVAKGKIDALFNIGLGFRPEATGRRNIELRGLMNGWSWDEIENRTEEIIRYSEMEGFIDLPFKAYSQGMAARLAFSIATAAQPDILLMDEWIGAGDAAFALKAAERMSTLVERAGIVVVASHSVELLRKFCTRGIRLEHGRIVAEGDLETVLGPALPAAVGGI